MVGGWVKSDFILKGILTKQMRGWGSKKGQNYYYTYSRHLILTAQVKVDLQNCVLSKFGVQKCQGQRHSFSHVRLFLVKSKAFS